MAQSSSKGSNPGPKICVFTKPFNSLTFDQLANHIADLGFDGIEAPIRKGGHIEPAEAPDKLPELHEALTKRGLEITLMTTDINDPDDPLTEKVIRTAATLGIERYRMKYFRYDLSKDIHSQITAMQPQVRDLAAMNHEFGMQGLYQNHAGKDYCGAPIWDLDLLLKGIPKSDLGVAYDIRHATVEGGTSWPITWKMIEHRVAMVYVKDFVWKETSRPANVPLGEGRVAKDFFRMLRKSKYDGPISLHEEYLDHRDPKLVDDHLSAMQRDLATLQSMLAES
ncbi:sugar phosphate isomerase/epimerase [Rubripirellula sp.]|nr:sugar phosphate isomerase/epimerase family protein [Rubripirellula sp.]MDB4338806.1 sugar phosphate isomerase/epimerase [Rubripirellula sp.]